MEKKVEALLFIAGKFLNDAQIVRAIGIDPISLHEVINKLKEKYKDSALNLVEMEIDGIKHYKMEVKDEYKDLAMQLVGKQEFSKAEQETLALIAYKQPIKQSIIIKMRSNKAYEHIKKFIAYGLVNAKPQGHTSVLSLTDKFYEYFDVKKEKRAQESNDEKKEKSVETDYKE